ncbi:hypothetical protein [Mesorhizobium sp.]|uniref:hypothetical protein n=1 Tax=Mesorhizobium sp. TaxID=1871066 RepID=UPI00257D04B1|nr:hypothetical protein [Mesorhizobium sp.]
MDLFHCAMRAKGDLAGAFEYDEADDPTNATAYFYLYRIEDGRTGSVIDAIHIRSGDWAIAEADISVRWDRDERRLGLFIFGALWATLIPPWAQNMAADMGKTFSPTFLGLKLNS